MKIKRLGVVIIILLTTFIVSCKKKYSDSVQYKSAAVEKTSKDFVIPRQLRIAIEKAYVAYIHKNNPKLILTDEEILIQIPREFLDIKFHFRASAPKVLTDHTEFLLPRGGGEIDLAKYVTGQKGSFYLTTSATRSESPNAELDNLAIYFLSNAKQRKIKNEIFGAGCKVYMNVTKLFNNANLTGGLQLNATDQRYLSVIGGVFYFINFSADRKIYLGAVRVIDSRYPEYLCDEKE